MVDFFFPIRDFGLPFTAHYYGVYTQQVREELLEEEADRNKQFESSKKKIYEILMIKEIQMNKMKENVKSRTF